MYCSHCGNKLDDDSLFCPECGQLQKLSNPVVDTSKNIRLSHMKPWLLGFVKSRAGKAICSIAVIILVALIILICIPKEKNSPYLQDNSMVDDFSAVSYSDAVISSGEVISSETENLLEVFSESELYELNLFLSNFSETRMESYPTDEYYLLSFVFEHCYINRPSLISYRSEEACISRNDVDSILMRFFGKTIEESYQAKKYTSMDGPGDSISYSDSQYRRAVVDGEFFNYVSIAKSVRDNNDGTYSVSFNIYLSSEDSLSQFYYMSIDKAVASDDLTFEQEGIAVIKPYIEFDGTASYQLIEYSAW